MKRYILTAGAIALSISGLYAQGAMDAMNFSRPDLKGTARFMSMGGAFGALGGDLSTLSQNPAGIGVYRQSEIGVTVNLDNCHSSASAQGSKTTMDGTRFLLNNIGGVATFKLPSSACPNINIGFTFNKVASFNRTYNGTVRQLRNSMSNYIAGMSNANNVSVGDVETTTNYNPYNPNDGFTSAPWLSILGYDSYLMNPSSDDNYNPNWQGQWGSNTSGRGYFNVQETGSIDEYNIALGGNIANVLFWGMNFDIVNFNFNQFTTWGESLDNAYVPDANGNIIVGNSDWNLNNYYSAVGTGFNYQLGFIVKPIQQLRIGVAMHTPTWYNMTETFYAQTNYKYPDDESVSSAMTNNGNDAYNDMTFRSPWKFIFSAAGVIGNKFIVSADYELTTVSSMKFGATNVAYGLWWGFDSGNDYDYGHFFDSSDPYLSSNNDIKSYLQSQSTIRLGAEYRVTPQLSVRAGYSYTTSPVKEAVRNNMANVNTSGTQPSYTLDNHTQYITCGLGYKISHFYIDLAYVYKNVNSTFHAYTPDTFNPQYESPTSDITLNNHQVVLSAGFKF